ncbi:MAG: sufD [Bacteroidetes bacterium]|jgi:Fe-S cluster assembly protein SufD|nr:sufD [Bacteroidota bacterium]
MSLALENKTSTSQNLISLLNSTAEKNTIIGFEQIGEALQYIEASGIPTAKNEEYKYCNTDAILRKEFKQIGNKFSTPATLPSFDAAINVYMINGRFHSVAGAEKGIVISSLEEAAGSSANGALVKEHLAVHALPSSDAFTAINTAYCQNGVFIRIERNTAIQLPVFIHHITQAVETAFINPRTLIVAESGSNCTVVDFYHAAEGANYFSTHTSEIVVKENAHLNHLRIQAEKENAFSVHTIEAVQSADSTYDASTFIFGGNLVRNNHLVRLLGKNIESHLNGLIIGTKNRLIDNHTYIDHAMPNCNSNELYKGVAYDKATIVFNGKIMVRRDAQKTNAYQSSKNILMSDDATVNTKPQLEIYADDVKCSHGTSTGKVDEEALFYLKARGIGDTSARKLLLQAFAQELIDKVEIPALQENILNLFEASLN